MGGQLLFEERIDPVDQLGQRKGNEFFPLFAGEQEQIVDDLLASFRLAASFFEIIP